jgi:hypothetical protein
MHTHAPSYCQPQCRVAAGCCLLSRHAARPPKIAVGRAVARLHACLAVTQPEQAMHIQAANVSVTRGVTAGTCLSADGELTVLLVPMPLALVPAAPIPEHRAILTLLVRLQAHPSPFSSLTGSSSYTARPLILLRRRDCYSTTYRVRVEPRARAGSVGAVKNVLDGPMSSKAARTAAPDRRTATPRIPTQPPNAVSTTAPSAPI